MCETKKHPSMEEIMEFVTFAEKNDIEKRKKTYEMIAHFVSCEECRTIKNQMIKFVDCLEETLSSAAENMLSKKILYSAELLNMREQMNDKNIKMAFRGIVAKNTADSKILLSEQEKTQMGFGYVNEQQTENEIADDHDNRIFLGEECIRVTLSDDGSKEHGVLMIPAAITHSPVYTPMEKTGQTWEMTCSCQEDEYDIVIF